MSAGVLAIEYEQLCFCLFDRDLRLQAPKNTQNGAQGPNVVRRLSQPHVEAGKRKLEAPWQHTYDRVRRRSQSGRFADDQWIAAETALPQRCTDDRHRWPAGRVFFRTKTASQRRLHAQNSEEILRNTRSLEDLRAGPAG